MLIILVNMAKRPSLVGTVKLNQRLGEVVNKARLELGISQPELARRTHLSTSYISYLESGKFEEIGISKLAAIVDALELSADRLLTDAGYLDRKSPTPPRANRFLATEFGLDQHHVKSAMDYLNFLRSQNRKKARTKP
jgi:transcriptional regulator with XRE-family HTH domain